MLTGVTRCERCHVFTRPSVMVNETTSFVSVNRVTHRCGTRYEGIEPLPFLISIGEALVVEAEVAFEYIGIRDLYPPE